MTITRNLHFKCLKIVGQKISSFFYVWWWRCANRIEKKPVWIWTKRTQLIVRNVLIPYHQIKVKSHKSLALFCTTISETVNKTNTVLHLQTFLIRRWRSVILLNILFFVAFAHYSFVCVTANGAWRKTRELSSHLQWPNIWIYHTIWNCLCETTLFKVGIEFLCVKIMPYGINPTINNTAFSIESNIRI